jgi:predicted permease
MAWDLRIFVFLTVVCVLNALLFGVVPALRATRVDPNEVLKASQCTQHSARLPLGRFLVAAQLALSLALVVGSGLFLATLRNLYEIDLGFNRENLLMATLDPHLAGFDSKQTKAAYSRMLQELNTLPAVNSATMVNDPLLGGRAHLSNAKVPSYVPQPGEDLANSWTVEYDVGPRFFETLKMPLVAGRDFTERDDENAPLVAIVNEAMAKHFFAVKNPLGQKILLSSIFKASGQASAEVVGLVRNAHYFDVKDERQEAIFVPALQIPAGNFGSEQTLLIRTTGNPVRAASDLRSVVHRIDPNLLLFDVITMRGQLDHSLSTPRLMAMLSSFFGLLALALSAIGLYGVLAYAVTKRTGEIGIRMALGADRGSILGLILGETMRLVSSAIAVGIVLAGAASRLIKSMIYGLTPHDARVFALSALLLLMVAVLATLLPARRAIQVDPMVALRCE